VAMAKVAFCRLRSGTSHRPSVRSGERSSHGHSVNRANRNPGSRIPPSNAPLTVNPPIRTVVEATNSCSQTKYHGAFAGFGVTDGLARPSSGALKSSAASKVRLNTTRKTNAIRRDMFGDEKTWSDSSSPVELITWTEVPGVIPNSE